MVETITPVVHGGRRPKYWLAVGLHAAGAGLAAAALGIALGASGSLLGAPWEGSGAVIVAALAAAYAGRELLGWPLPLPERRRQVPDWWRTFYGPSVAAFLYGAGLGIGFATFLGHGTFVAVAAGAVATGDPVLGASLCAPFGLARGLSVVVAGGAGTQDPASPVDRLEALAATGAVRAANGVALAGVATVAIVAA